MRAKGAYSTGCDLTPCPLSGDKDSQAKKPIKMSKTLLKSKLANDMNKDIDTYLLVVLLVERLVNLQSKYKTK